MKRLKRLAVAALAAVALVTALGAPAQASNDRWQQAGRNYYYGSNASVTVNIGFHTWDLLDSTSMNEGVFDLHQSAGGDVRSVQLAYIRVWDCRADGTDCYVRADWDGNPYVDYCLAVCNDHDVLKTTDKSNCFFRVEHVAAKYRFQWENGNLSEWKVENSGNIGDCP